MSSGPLIVRRARGAHSLRDGAALVARRGARGIEAVTTAVLVCAIALYAGRAVSDFGTRTFGLGHGSVFAFTAIALILMALLRAATFPGFVAVAALAVMNGIPGMDVESLSVPGAFRVSDVVIVALVVVLATHQEVDGDIAHVIRRAQLWSTGFVLWWAFTWTRSVADGIPAVDAALFGRDFLYFAVLLPLAIGAFGRRRDIYVFLGVLAVGTVIYEVAQIAITGAGIEGTVTSLFVHESLSNELGGLHRVYAYMDYVVPAAVAVGLGLAITPPRRSARVAGTFLAALSTISVLLAFTRATYLGLAVGFLLVSIVWMRRRSAASVGLQRVLLAAAGAVLVLVISGGYRSLIGSAASAQVVSTRAATVLEDLQQRRGTVEYRYELQAEMRRVLGNRWLQGLGFQHPEAHPTQTLPSGSIRNADLGVMNSVMTMGLIGTLFLYAPPLALLIAIFRSRGPDNRERRHEWMAFGMAVWLTYVLVSSLTLVTLFSVPGLVLTALLIGCAVRLLADDARAEWSPQSS